MKGQHKKNSKYEQIRNIVLVSISRSSAKDFPNRKDINLIKTMRTFLDAAERIIARRPE